MIFAAMISCIQKGILSVLLLLSGIIANAQYINTDSLMLISGYNSPLSIVKVDSMEWATKLENSSFLSRFLIPGKGDYVISRFGPRSGRMHYGIDLKMNKGDTVFATMDGNVARAGYGYGFGNLVVIQHDFTINTYYAHLSTFLVKAGEWVNKGEPIGLAGSTGRARGNHLHYEMRENDRPFDPEMVFDFDNNKIREDAWYAETLAELHRKLKPKGYSKNISVPEYYKVSSGDSLWVISKKFKTSINEICRLNKISENTVLQIGQALKMY